MESFLPFLQTVLMLFFMFHVCVFLSNLAVADCIINENVMLLFIKNEHFTLLNSVCFWGTSSPNPLTPGPHWGLGPQTPLQPRASALGIYWGGANIMFAPSIILLGGQNLLSSPNFQ